MTDNNEVKLAKQTIQSLVQNENIARIFYVDDYFEANYDVEKIIGWLSTIPDQQQEEIQRIFPDIPFGAPFEIWAREINNYWKRLSPDGQREIFFRVSLIFGTRFQQDYRVATKLSTYFPRRFTPKSLSPTQWIEQRDQILNGASEKEKVLCLFDQDLSEADGFQDEGPRSGIGLIQDIINRDLLEVVICCLLTRTITSIENEMADWRRLAKENGMDLYQFLPLAKKRVYDHESPFIFVDGLKKALLNRYCEKWKEIAVEIIRQSNELAIESLLDIDVYDFDHMVFQVSLDEGIVETEILVRLFQIFQKDYFRERFLAEENFTNLSSLVASSRPIVKVNTNHTNNRSFHQVRPIRRKELYEMESTILNTPLQLGDVLKNHNDQKDYVLLGQPCDLMVRSNGELNGKRSNNRLLVPLVPINRIPFSEFLEKKANHWRTHHYIHYFYSDSDDVGEIWFKDAILIPVEILDLAVIDPDGFCKINIKEPPAIPITCTSGWKKNLADLISHYSVDSHRLSEIQKYVKKMRKKEVRQFIKESLIDAKGFNEGTYDFKWQRICRIREAGALHILKAYSQYLARDADDVDFAKDL